jgi:uncharacterized protein (TIGR02466 family)
MHNASIFATPLWGYVLTTQQAHLHKYIAKIQSLSQQESSVSKSNFGGWQSRDDLHKVTTFAPFVRTLEELAVKALEPYTTQKPCIQSMWANINFKHNYNAHHTHEGWLSGVFYLQTPPNAGRLIFVNPAVRSEQSPVRARNYAIEPEPLACILFPSWLEHYVEPSRSDTPRISISFNIGDK